MDVVFQARLTAASADMPSVVNAVAVTDAFGMERSSSAETQVIGLMNTVPPVLRSGATAAWSPQIEAHNIELVGYLGSSPVEVLAVQGNRAYVGAGNELSVIDVSDPANPAALRRYDSPGPEVRSMAVLEGRLFMTTGDGLMTLDMSDPSVSLMGGFYSLDRISRTSRDVAVQGHYAYVAAGWDGLQVVDSSDATNPRVVSAFDTPGHAWAIALRDGLAYIADENHGLRVIDVQDPLHRFEIGWHDVPGPYEFSQGVAVEGRYAYITDGQGLEPGLRIFDIAEPTSPTELANLLLDAPGDGAVLPRAEDVDVSEGYAYLAAGTAGLRVVDVADPTRPVEICTYKTPGRSHSLTVSGQFVYLTDGDLRVLGVSNHAAVEEVGFYDLPGSAQAPSVAVQGSPAVVTGQGSAIFDITTPSLPMVVAAHPLPYGRVAMDGERVCVVNGGLFVLRFSPS